MEWIAELKPISNKIIEAQFKIRARYNVWYIFTSLFYNRTSFTGRICISYTAFLSGDCNAKVGNDNLEK